MASITVVPSPRYRSGKALAPSAVIVGNKSACEVPISTAGKQSCQGCVTHRNASTLPISEAKPTRISGRLP